MSTIAIKRRIVEGAQTVAKKYDIELPDIFAITQPLAELITAETGIEVEFVLVDKRTNETLAN